MLISEKSAALFWAKVDKTTEGGCWLWLGYRLKHRRGHLTYGRLSIDHQALLAHRVAWMIVNGAIPEGMHVLHRCDTMPCCNPAHLFLGDDQANQADCIAKGRRSRGGWKNVPRPSRAWHWRKLSDDDVRSIRADPRPQRAIAKDFGIGADHVSRIKSRERWGHLV